MNTFHSGAACQQADEPPDARIALIIHFGQDQW
jgi:hypothetical protein